VSSELDNLGEQLSAFLDGELPPADAAALEQRLARDPALRLELEELAEVKRLVGGLPRAKAPASIKAAIRERLERQSLLAELSPAAEPRRGWLIFIHVAAAAAAFLLVTTVTYMVHLHSQPRLPVAVKPPVLAPTAAKPDEVAAAGERDVCDSSGDSAVRKDFGGAKLKRAPEIALLPGKSQKRETGFASKAAAGLDAKDGVARTGSAGVDNKSAQNKQQFNEDEVLANRLSLGNITAGEVQQLYFESEPVVLNVAVPDAQRQKTVVEDLKKSLSRNNAVPVEKLDKKTELTPDDHAFYLQGKENKNFDERPGLNQVQIVARVRRDVAEKLVVQANRDSEGQADVQLRQDQAKSREVRQQLAEGRALEQIARGGQMQRYEYKDQGGSPPQVVALAPAPARPTSPSAGPRTPEQPGEPATHNQPKLDDGPATTPPPNREPPANSGQVGQSPGAPADKLVHAEASPTASVPGPTTQPVAADRPPATSQVQPGPGRPGDRIKEEVQALADATTQPDGYNAVLAGQDQRAQQPGKTAGDAEDYRRESRDGWVNLVINVYAPTGAPGGPAEAKDAKAKDADAAAEKLHLEVNPPPATQSGR
jgi:hypothetical protein